MCSTIITFFLAALWFLLVWDHGKPLGQNLQTAALFGLVALGVLTLLAILITAVETMLT